MSGIDSGNTATPQQNGANNDGGEYDRQDCPMCGESVKLLPPHLRHSCPATGDDDE